MGDEAREMRTLACSVPDINGATVVFPSAAELKLIFEGLMSLDWSQGAQVVRVKNRFHSSIEKPLAGYRDLQVLLFVHADGPAGPEPALVELQLHLESFYREKKAMHLAYECRRGSFDHRR